MGTYNYSETPVEGTSRVRARHISIQNNLFGNPRIEYIEQRVTAIGQRLDCLDVGVLSRDINMEGVIELRDLTTGELTGETIPVSAVYHALYSDYLNQAFERDNAPDIEPEAPSL